MGCDIHGVFQVKIGNHWRDVESCYMLERHYNTFGALAGVRNNDMPLFSEPRGLPDDFYMDGEHHEGDSKRIWMGEHSHSWATWDELAAFHTEHAVELIETDIAIICYALRKVRDDVARITGKYGKAVWLLPKHVRFVFGFDS